MQQHSKLDTVDEKYQRTFIYGIICLITGEMYVGSTILTLDERIAIHIQQRSCSAWQILERGSYNTYVIQKWPCNTKREVLALEGGWQRAYKASFGDFLVNKKIEGYFTNDSPEVKAVYDKEWGKEHKERIQVYKHQPWTCEWCDTTMTTGARGLHKRRCKSNPEHVPLPGLTDEQKERVHVYNRQPWTCEWCDTTMRRDSGFRHKRRCKSKPTHT
jgi:hypothetical protein